MANFEKIYPNIERFEAGYSNTSADTGNYCDGKLVGTNRGISAIQYKGVYGKCPTIAEMKNLSYNSAKRIWKENYFDDLKLERLKSNELAELYIFSVGGGSSGNLHVRQSANKVLGRNKFPESRSKLTDSELEQIHKLNETKMFNEFYKIRRKFFAEHPNKGFISGWLRRLDDIKLRFSSGSKSTGIVLPLAFLGFGVTLLGVYLYKKYAKK
jgi:lysozyme family protein